MADDLGIDLNLKNLATRTPVGRAGTPSSPVSGEKATKSLGDPPAPRADLADYTDRLRVPFAYGGILSMLQRKLNALGGVQYTIIPCQGDRVSIDEHGVVHLGMAFLDENLENIGVLAGVLSHEWGHFPTRRKTPNLDALSWDEVYKLRREEETRADMFCGRALFLLGYPVEPLIHYLRAHEDPERKSPKYHTAGSREEVIRKSYESQRQRNSLAGNIQLADAVYGDPIHTTRLIGS